MRIWKGPKSSEMPEWLAITLGLLTLPLWPIAAVLATLALGVFAGIVSLIGEVLVKLAGF